MLRLPHKSWYSLLQLECSQGHRCRVAVFPKVVPEDVSTIPLEVLKGPQLTGKPMKQIRIVINNNYIHNKIMLL